MGGYKLPEGLKTQKGVNILGFAKLAIHGNLVRDPETKTTQNGASVCSFSVACNIYRGQSAPAETLYVRCSAWRQLGETCQKALKKGQGVVVWGKAGVHAWNDTRDGNAKGALELEVEGFDFAGRKPEGETAPAQETGPTEMVEADDDELPF